MATLENAQYEKDLVGVGVQLGVAAVIIVACVHLFEVLRKRPRFQHLFTPRCRLVKNPTPPIPPGLYAWLPHVWRLDEEFYYTHVGLDAVMHLRFLRMTAQLFGVVGLLIFAVLMPINYLTHSSENAREVSQFSVSNIPSQSHYFWAHLVFLYVLCFALMYLLLRNSLDYAKMLSDSMLLKVSSGSIVPRSVLVSHVPSNLRNDAALKRFFEILGLGPVDSATMIRNYSKLNRRINQRKAVLQSLEQSHLDLARAFVALARKNQSFLMEVPVHDDPKAMLHNQACEDMLHYLQLIRKGRKGRKDLTTLFEKDPMFFWRALSNLHRPLLDSSQPKIHVKHISESDWDPTIDTLLYKLAKVERRVRQLRQPTKVAENFKPTRYGVVTFRHYNAAQACIRLTVSGQLHHLSTSMCPEPRDLMWSHFLFDERQKLIRFLVINGCVWTLIIVWLIPMVPFVGLASLDNLIKLFPFLEPLSVNSPWLKNFIERNVPSMLTSLLMVILPFIVFAISRLQFFPSHSALEETVIQRNFYFAIFNVLIFFCAGPPLIKSVEAWWKNPISLLDTLATSLTGQGEAFFINYVIFTSCSHALELSQIGIPLISTIFADNRWLLSTPRKAQRYRSPWSFPYFYYLPTHMLIFVISLTFAVTTPLMIPFSLYYFFSAFIVYKHQFAYAYVKQYEANGRYWIHMLNFSMFGMCFTVIMFILVMSLKKAVAPAIATAPLLFMCLAFAMYIRRNLFPRMKTVPLQHTAVTHLQVEQNQEEPDTVAFARTFPRMTSPLARANTDGSDGIHKVSGQVGAGRSGDLGSGNHSESSSSSSSCDRPSGVLSSTSESCIFPGRDTDTIDTMTTMGTQKRSSALPTWYQPWMRYLGLQALCYHWHNFCKSLVTSTIDYKPHDLEAVQMYRGTQPVLERVIASTSTPDGKRSLAVVRRRGNTLTLGSAGGEDRLSIPNLHGKVVSEDFLAPPGSSSLSNSLRGTCLNSPHLLPTMRASRALSFHSICGSEVSHNEGHVSNLKLCQDLSTPLESYLHPRLIKALTRRLWVPANPLQRLYHDLEAECIELDAALVTAALLATNPKAGQLRSTYKFAEQYEWQSSSKKSLLNHIPYFYKINRTAKDLSAGTQKLLTEITTDLTGELKKKTSPVMRNHSEVADGGGHTPRNRSMEVTQPNRRSGLGSRNEFGAGFMGILRSSFTRTRAAEDPQPSSRTSHSLSNSTLSAPEKEDKSNLSITLRSHPSRSMLTGHTSMNQEKDYRLTTPVKVTDNTNPGTADRESEPTSDATLTRSAGDVAVELGFRAFNHSPPPLLSVSNENDNVQEEFSVPAPILPSTVAPPMCAATRRHSFNLSDFSPTGTSTGLPDQSMWSNTIDQSRPLRRLSWRPRVHFTGENQRDVGVEVWPLLQARRSGGITTPESCPSPPSVAGSAKGGDGGKELELLPAYSLGRSATIAIPSAMDNPNALHESCTITVYDSPTAASSLCPGSSSAAITPSSGHHISRQLTVQSMQGGRCVVVPASVTSGADYAMGDGSGQVAIDGLNERSPSYLPQSHTRHSLAASDELLGMLSDGLSHEDSDSEGSGCDAEGDAAEMRGLYEEDW